MSRRINSFGSETGTFSSDYDRERLYFTTSSGRKYRVVNNQSISGAYLGESKYRVEYHLAPGFQFPWDEKIVVDSILTA